MCHFLNEDCSLKEKQLVLPIFADRHPFPGHIYIIIDRGEPLSGIEFCSGWCTETYVERMPGNWEIVSESFPFNFERRNGMVHAVEIRRRQEGLVFPRESREAGAT